jgi:hypothetical protein
VPQTIMSARSQVRWAVLKGISSAIHPSSSNGAPSTGLLARSAAGRWAARTAVRRAASRSSACTQIRMSIRCATSRRPAPSPSMISSGQPAGTSIDPSRPRSDADTFNKFFAGAARMGEFLSGAGVVGEPEVTVLDAVDVAGQF